MIQMMGRSACRVPVHGDAYHQGDLSE